MERVEKIDEQTKQTEKTKKQIENAEKGEESTGESYEEVKREGMIRKQILNKLDELEETITDEEKHEKVKKVRIKEKITSGILTKKKRF